ncbi:hypothetical protein HAX54_004811, partial [Datura stramonium]|nr:hypothetical protein [Datura stramonium]
RLNNEESIGSYRNSSNGEDDKDEDNQSLLAKEEELEKILALMANFDSNTEEDISERNKFNDEKREKEPGSSQQPSQGTRHPSPHTKEPKPVWVPAIPLLVEKKD